MFCDSFHQGISSNLIIIDHGCPAFRFTLRTEYCAVMTLTIIKAHYTTVWRNKMRQRISQKNVFPVFDLEAEYRKLQNLFFDSSAFGHIFHYGQSRPCLSFFDCLQKMFLDWNLRGSFTSAEEMMTGLEIGEKDFQRDMTEEHLLDYIQFISNAALFVSIDCKRYDYYRASAETLLNAILDHSRLILNRLGAEMNLCDEEVVVFYKDDVASAVAEQNEDLNPNIMEYLKIDNRGNLQRKGELLCTFYKELEPYESAFKGTELKTLYSDTDMLFNKIGARHALKEKDCVEKKIMDMGRREQEMWYDRAFQMFLTCMAAVPYLEYKSEIRALRKDE